MSGQYSVTFTFLHAISGTKSGLSLSLLGQLCDSTHSTHSTDDVSCLMVQLALVEGLFFGCFHHEYGS